MMSPLVSVIIPVYNRYEWLEVAVKSVLKQTYDNYEIIIVDDGSTENLSCIKRLNPRKIIYYKNENHGIGYSRNFGIKKASGKYVAFLDSDDFWDEKKLQIQINKLEASKYHWSQHNYYYYSNDLCKIVSKINTACYAKYYKYAIFCSFKVQTSCFIVDRQELINSNCFFDESKNVGEDIDFYLKMIKKYPLQFIDEYLSYFRIRENNAGFDARKQIFSRAALWIKYKDDKYVNSHISFMTVLAYKWCVIVNNIKWITTSKKISAIAYLVPWTIFKLEGIKYRIWSNR